MKALQWIFQILSTCFTVCLCRKHTLELNNDGRLFFPVSTFGFYKEGYLEVEISKFSIQPGEPSHHVGFVLDRTLNDAVNPFLESHRGHCLLENWDALTRRDNSTSFVFFTFDFIAKQLRVQCSPALQRIKIRQTPSPRARLLSSNPVDSKNNVHRDGANAIRQKRSPPEQEVVLPEILKKKIDTIKKQDRCSHIKLPLKSVKNETTAVSTKFVVYIESTKDEGLYGLSFHNCENYHSGQTTVSLKVSITERNQENYLSAGEMPLPAVFFMMTLLFFLAGCLWVYILRKSAPQNVARIHYLMAVLIFTKALSLCLHGINYHYIQKEGYHARGWAILYYLTHLFKGALLFITIVLIGAGWTFVKMILSDKDKRLFMIVIPLQVLANVAVIIIEESEEGEVEHTVWQEIFILIDLICCAAILLPIVWSIRHLQEASQTDGKAIISLRKLKLFRYFYVMVVCYIYFTRIIVYLLRVTLPFQYEWMDQMFRELGTLVFFVLTGYYFRPISDHPYMAVEEDGSEDGDEVVLEMGAKDWMLDRSLLSETFAGKSQRRRKSGEEDEERQQLMKSADV